MSDPGALQLAELNHRVANSYQALAALVRLERTRSPDEEGFARIEAQLNAITLVHRLLKDVATSSSSEVAALEREMNGATYLELLCRGLDETCIRPRGGVLTLSSDPVTLPGRCLQILGTIVTELVLNAAKHALALRGEGSVKVEMQDGANGRVIVSVEDDGPGFRPIERKANRGLDIVERLARSVGGDCRMDNSKSGSRVIVEFVRP